MYAGGGLAFRAVREDEIAAEALGIATTREKVEAFFVSAFFAGVAGALFAHSEGYIHTNSFSSCARSSWWRWWCSAGSARFRRDRSPRPC